MRNCDNKNGKFINEQINVFIWIKPPFFLLSYLILPMIFILLLPPYPHFDCQASLEKPMGLSGELATRARPCTCQVGFMTSPGDELGCLHSPVEHEAKGSQRRQPLTQAQAAGRLRLRTGLSLC